MKNKITGVLANRNQLYYNSFLKLLPNPNKEFVRVDNNKTIVAINNIRNDPHVASCIQSRHAGVLSQMWEIQAHEQNEAIRKFIQDIFRSLNIPRIMTEFLEAPLNGYAVSEVYWLTKIIEGKLYTVPVDIIGKPKYWFYFDRYNMLNLFDAMGVEGQLVPNKKFILVQHKSTYDNPYGEAILSKCLWPVVFKKGGITFWMRFIEKFGMPHYLGKTDTPQDMPDYENFLEQVDNIRQDASAIISTQDDISILDGSNASSPASFKDLIDYQNHEISKAILSQTMTTEIQGTGSYAAGKVHAMVRQDIIEGDKQLVINAFNQLIQWICEVNFGDQIEYPRFVMYDKEDVDKPLAEVAELLQKNKTVRMLPPFYVNRFGFKEDEFEILEWKVTAPATDIPPIDNQTYNKPSYEFQQGNFPDQTIIDAFGDRALKEDSKIFNPLIDLVKNFLNKQSSFEEAINGLVKLLPDMNSKELETKLTNLLFMADVIGRLSVTSELKHG